MCCYAHTHPRRASWARCVAPLQVPRMRLDWSASCKPATYSPLLRAIVLISMLTMSLCRQGSQTAVPTSRAGAGSGSGGRLAIRGGAAAKAREAVRQRLRLLLQW